MKIILAIIEWYGENCFAYHISESLVDMGHQVEIINLLVNKERENGLRLLAKVQFFYLML